MAKFVMFMSADGYQNPILVDPAKVCAVKEGAAGVLEIYVGGPPILVSGTMGDAFAKVGVELED